MTAFALMSGRFTGFPVWVVLSGSTETYNTCQAFMHKGLHEFMHEVMIGNDL